jgi:hypothetical protein
VASDGVKEVTLIGQDGSTTKASVVDNLFVALLPRASAPNAITWRDASGREQRQFVSLPSDAATATCA